MNLNEITFVLPRFLYHAAPIEVAESILREGIKPRKATVLKRDGHRDDNPGAKAAFLGVALAYLTAQHHAFKSSASCLLTIDTQDLDLRHLSIPVSLARKSSGELTRQHKDRNTGRQMGLNGASLDEFVRSQFLVRFQTGFYNVLKFPYSVSLGFDAELEMIYGELLYLGTIEPKHFIRVAFLTNSDAAHSCFASSAALQKFLSFSHPQNPAEEEEWKYVLMECARRARVEMGRFLQARAIPYEHALHELAMHHSLDVASAPQILLHGESD